MCLLTIFLYIRNKARKKIKYSSVSLSIILHKSQQKFFNKKNQAHLIFPNIQKFVIMCGLK